MKSHSWSRFKTDNYYEDECSSDLELYADDVLYKKVEMRDGAPCFTFYDYNKRGLPKKKAVLDGDFDLHFFKYYWIIRGKLRLQTCRDSKGLRSVKLLSGANVDNDYSLWDGFCRLLHIKLNKEYEPISDIISVRAEMKDWMQYRKKTPSQSKVEHEQFLEEIGGGLIEELGLELPSGPKGIPVIARLLVCSYEGGPHVTMRKQTFDEKGQIESDEGVYFDDEDSSAIETEYSICKSRQYQKEFCDQYGNWILRVSYSKGKLAVVIHRRIEYK